MSYRIVSTEDPEWIPINRNVLADLIQTPKTSLNNWIDRNRIWDSERSEKFHRSYRLSEVFDLAGFAAMRTAKIPVKDCATYTRNFGFYRVFLHEDNQLAQMSFRDGAWMIGVFDPSAAVVLSINMRTIGTGIFQRIAKSIIRCPNEWPSYSFESFKKLYSEAVGLNRLPARSVSEFGEA